MGRATGVSVGAGAQGSLEGQGSYSRRQMGSVPLQAPLL